MSIRERLKQKCHGLAGKEDDEPEWVAKGAPSTRSLFRSAEAEYQRIKQLILESKSPKDREQRLVLARIAEAAGKSRSLLNPRRQPDLCSWVREANTGLEALARGSATHGGSAKRVSRRQLERELSRIKREVKNRTEEDRREIVEAFFASNLLEDRDKLARDNSRLKIENESLLQRNSRLTACFNEHQKTYSQILQLLTPKQRAMLKGLTLV